MTSTFDRSAVENNIADVVRDTRGMTRAGLRRNVRLSQLSEASGEIGELDTASVDENGNLRVIQSPNNLLERFGVSAHFAGFAADGVTPTFWLSSDDGSANFLGGNAFLDGDGLNILGLVLAQYFEATNGGETRRVFIGMNVPQGETVPVFSIMLTGPIGSELATNGDFETGDETGWTDSGSAWTVSSDSPYEGTYSGWHDGLDGVVSGNLVKDTATVAAGDVVVISFANKRNAGILAGKLKVEFLSSVPAVLSTEYIYGTTSNSWTTFQQYFVAPGSSASVRVTWVPADPFNDEEIDALSIYVTDTFQELRLGDDGFRVFDNGVERGLTPEYRQNATMFCVTDMITSVTTGITNDAAQRFGYYMGPTAGNANDGDEYNFSFTIASGTFTIELIGFSNSSAGKTDVYIDGVSVGSGLDWYSAVATNNVSKTVSSVAITAGEHTLKVKVNGKNASSSDYRWLGTLITIKPAAYV